VWDRGAPYPPIPDAADMNKAWHEAHKMAKNPTHAERVKWHIAHAKHCACRKPPESVREEVERALKQR
jgi:hypothetical protein